MSILRINIKIQGTVQGVGFRPFIFRLANELNLKGFINNSSSGVTIEAEGEKSELDNFIYRIKSDKPNLSKLSSFDFHYLDLVGYNNFTINQSEISESINAHVLPDIAVCSDCLKEMNDPDNRRFRYPFINCTNCGPRFSIIEALPYDRPNTSMKFFAMCPDCRREYENPYDRRYHAQPIACPNCGPYIELWDSEGKFISFYEQALDDACKIILEGNILALKGIGGFQFICDARNNVAVKNLRDRKRREEKPLAIMCPDLESAKSLCEISDIEETLLFSPESPIVLLKRNRQANFSADYLSDFIAPDNPYLGIMLPYSPLHHLLLNILKIPIVATSGNLSEEPISINEYDAVTRLAGIADYFLVNNRPIVRHVDDSIVRIIAGRKTIIRRARGYAPLPVIIDAPDIPDDEGLYIDEKRDSIIHKNGNDKDSRIHKNDNQKSILAVGAHLKNSIALKKGKNVFISQHIGDLSTNEANSAFIKVINDFEKLYDTSADKIICDLHPEYLSTKYSKGLNKNLIQVQHHVAHVLSCRLENSVSGKALGVAWDGTGLGFDGSIWGGEFFISDDSTIEHICQFRRFPLPGGEIAIKEPRRSAAGMLYQMMNGHLFDSENIALLNNFSNEERSILYTILNKQINCPKTSSLGRIFDTIASLLNLKQKSGYEGQAAMSVEFIADPEEQGSYPVIIKQEIPNDEMEDSCISNNDKTGKLKNILIIDWEPMLNLVLSDISEELPTAKIAAKFHNYLSDTIVYLAEMLKLQKVILSGGCFQNKILTEQTIIKLLNKGIQPYWHQLVPTNDGGIALGQINFELQMKAINPFQTLTINH
ncbi:MAG: carbamoyltransferase HypF [Candidatus Kapabacteria bacterium]|nr:carbamoyltransferase HypF [Candidatus Kapabacteria bacterium]